jgi:hypothetical protein
MTNSSLSPWQFHTAINVALQQVTLVLISMQYPFLTIISITYCIFFSNASTWTVIYPTYKLLCNLVVYSCAVLAMMDLCIKFQKRSLKAHFTPHTQWRYVYNLAPHQTFSPACLPIVAHQLQSTNHTVNTALKNLSF